MSDNGTSTPPLPSDDVPPDALPPDVVPPDALPPPVAEASAAPLVLDAPFSDDADAPALLPRAVEVASVPAAVDVASAPPAESVAPPPADCCESMPKDCSRFSTRCRDLRDI